MSLECHSCAHTLDQVSAGEATEARQERVIVEVVRKGIVAGRCWSMC